MMMESQPNTNTLRHTQLKLTRPQPLEHILLFRVTSPLLRGRCVCHNDSVLH